MECHNCQTTLPNDAMFCLKCGHKQNKLCHNCQHELPSEAVFCLKCGAKVDDAPKQETPIKSAEVDSSLEHYIPKELLDRIKSAQKTGQSQNERRIVTMLFCDLEGSTAAAEVLDPEDWAEIMNGAFEYLIKPVYKYEGVLARLMGDAILAFFGAPLAHEDDPERAILTALEIANGIKPYLDEVKSKWEIDVNFRVGINTGLVVVGDMGSDMRVEYTAMGDAINLASRMESSAEPGTIQISDNTYKLVEHLFDFVELGAMEIKGKSIPIDTYKVTGRKTQRRQIRGLKGFTSPLVAREKEFQQIHEIIDRLIDGHGHVLSVTAEVGIGKTRLISEVNNHLQTIHKISNINTDNTIIGSDSSIFWFQGASLSYQTNVAFAPFIDIMGKMFDFTEIKDDTAKYDRILSTLFRYAGSPQTAPFLASLFNIEPSGNDIDRIKYLDPPLLRAKIFESILQFFQMLTKHKPVALILDDLHWADASTIELLKSMLKLSQTEMITIILLFRPNRSAISWEVHEHTQREYQHIYTNLSLESLNYEKSSDLIGNLLEIEGLGEEIVNLIFEKSDGNPLFIEEVVGTLVDQELIQFGNSGWQVSSDFTNLSIPDTLSGVLTARLDGLDDESKRISRIASVIGREFRLDILEDIYEGNISVVDALFKLQQREMVIEKSKKPYQIFYFKHSMTHEIAYNSLLLKRRRELHSKIAQCLERRDQDNVLEISRHFYEAQEYQNALPYLIKAASQASKAYSNQEAISLFTTAKEIRSELTSIHDTKQLYTGLGKTYMLIGEVDKAVAVYDELLGLAKEANDHDCQVTALNQLGYLTALFIGDIHNSLTYLDESEELAKSYSIDFGLAENLMIRCNIDTATAQFDDATEHLSEAALIGERLEEANTQLYGMTHMANTFVYMANFEDAYNQAVKTIERARELGDKTYLTELLTFSFPFVLLLKGDLIEAGNIAAEGLELADEIGTPANQLHGNMTLAEIAILTGNYEKAIRHAKVAKEHAKVMGIPAYMTYVRSCQKHIDIELGNFGEELNTEFEEILGLLDHPWGAFLGGKTWTIYGMFLNNSGQYEDAIQNFNNVSEIPNTLMYLYEPFALLGKVWSLISLQRSDEALELTHKVENIINEKGFSILKPQLLYLKSIQASNEERKKFIEEAESIANKMGLKPILWKIQMEYAKILKEMGDIEAASLKEKSAKATIDFIKINMNDQKVVELFAKHTIITNS
ncbi:MAG: AAA family ATPase [Candidatus Heimdallarchaeota archaeon]|nr:AAA family ATPase [Candidatus Heimdallarchaeota archaeon]